MALESGLTIRELDAPLHTVLLWVYAGGPGQFLPNPVGVRVAHEIRCVRGAVEFRFADETVALAAGQSFTIEPDKPYDVVFVSGPVVEVRCFYPKADAAGIRSIAHLRGTITRPFFTRGEADVPPRPRRTVRRGT